MMKIGVANHKASLCYKLTEGAEYILVPLELTMLVYDLQGNYIVTAVPDVFNEIRDYCKGEDHNCLACDCLKICNKVQNLGRDEKYYE